MDGIPEAGLTCCDEVMLGGEEVVETCMTLLSKSAFEISEARLVKDIPYAELSVPTKWRPLPSIRRHCTSG